MKMWLTTRFIVGCCVVSLAGPALSAEGSSTGVGLGTDALQAGSGVSKTLDVSAAKAAQAMWHAGSALTPGNPFIRTSAGEIVSEASSWLGCGWGDFDGDGRLDLFVANVGGPNRLYRNNGDATFTRITTSDLGSGSTGCAWGDFDNDGRLDLLVANSGQAPWLYRNNGDGGFSKVTASGLVRRLPPTFSTAVVDYDRDGLLDVFIANAATANNLYRNMGTSTFQEAVTGEIVTDNNATIGGAWGDYDNDGHMDLFVANGGGLNNALYRNNGAGIFTKVKEGALVNDGGQSVSCAWGDYDNDGYLDLFVANRAGNNFLYRNNGNGTFTKITAGGIVTDGGESNGCVWLDYDNDGWLDLFVANRQGQNDFLYHNDGNGRFTRISGGELVEDGAESVAVASGDFDHDGFPDLFVSNYGQANRLYRNGGNQNRWLAVRCVGTAANRFGTGATVRVRTVVDGTERWQLRQITGGNSWNSESFVAQFGLGTAAEVDVLRVEWPSGRATEWRAVAVNQVLVVAETTPSLVTIAPPGGGFAGSVQVTLATTFGRGEIRYTLDNSEPVATSSLYTAPFVLQDSATVKAGLFTNGVVVPGMATATFTKLVGPSITEHPHDATVTEGERVEFRVVATGSQPLRYQWLVGDQDIGGATGSILELPRVKDRGRRNLRRQGLERRGRSGQ